MSFGSFMRNLHKEKGNKKNPKMIIAEYARENCFFNLKRILISTQLLALIAAIITLISIILAPSLVTIIAGIITILTQVFVFFFYSLLRQLVKIVEFHDAEIEDLKDNQVFPPPPNIE